MSLLKPRVLTPARLSANRRSAQKSTGPRTARGKAQSSQNGLRHGFCSPTYRRFWVRLFEAAPWCPVARTVRTMLTPEQSGHPVYARIIDVHYQMELEDLAYRRLLARRALREAKRSLEDIENNMSGENTNPGSLPSD